MKNREFKDIINLLFIGLVLITITGCERGLSDDVTIAIFPNDPDIYIDGFTGGLDYYPYGDSKQTAFSVDEETKYAGSSSMRFDVPNFGDPEGAYAGASFILGDIEEQTGGRNLTGYDALTFYAKASQGATLDNVGFGQDFGENKYQVTLQNVPLTTNWVKYIIPIPDANKLIQERGMFWYSEGPEDGTGYTIWIDELKFEKLGTIGQPRPKILNGENQYSQGVIGGTIPIGGLAQTFNLSSGQDITVSAAPSYFHFLSSNPFVASVNELGIISIDGTGVINPETGILENTALITAVLDNIDAAGSLVVESIGEFDFAPTPTLPASNVISIFSDAYINVPIDFYNGYWEPFQTTESADFAISGDNILNYTNFNFVGNSFANPTVDASAMTAIHFDIYIPGDLDPGAQLKIILRDLGPDGVDGGSDDTNQEVTFNASSFSSNEWSSLDIPLTIANKNRMGLIIYENLGSNLTDFYLDNIYFYN